MGLDFFPKNKIALPGFFIRCFLITAFTKNGKGMLGPAVG